MYKIIQIEIQFTANTQSKPIKIDLTTAAFLVIY